MDSSLSSIHFHVLTILTMCVFCIPQCSQKTFWAVHQHDFSLKVLQATLQQFWKMFKTSAVLKTQCGNGFIFGQEALYMCRDFKYQWKGLKGKLDWTGISVWDSKSIKCNPPVTCRLSGVYSILFNFLKGMRVQDFLLIF